MRRDRLFGSAVSLIVLVGSLIGALVVMAGAAASSMLGGSASYTLLPLLLMVMLLAAFASSALAAPSDHLESGVRGVVAIGILTFGIALGFAWLTALIGIPAAYAVDRKRDRQLSLRVFLVVVATLVAVPVCEFFGGLGNLIVPAAFAVGSIATADALSSER